jgi:hypothetical protein
MAAGERRTERISLTLEFQNSTYFSYAAVDIRKWHVPRASNPPGEDGWQAIAPRFGDSVVALDQVVASGRDFSQQDWPTAS